MNASPWMILGILLVVFALPVHATTSCNDIEVSPESVTLSEGQDNRGITFILSNDSDEDFDIDDVRVTESDSRLTLRVESFEETIEEDGTARVRLRYDTAEVNGDVQTTFTLSVRGEFNDGRDCSFSQIRFVIDATIEDGENTCTLIEAEAGDVFMDEDDTRDHFITIQNESNTDFDVQDLDLFDDSSAFTVRLKTRVSQPEFENIIARHSQRSYEIEIDSSRVTDDVRDEAFVEVQGRFVGGNSCDGTEISTSFEVEVQNTGETGLCAELRISPTLLHAESQITTNQFFTIENTGSQDYFIDEYDIRDVNYQVQFNALNAPAKIENENAADFYLDAIGFLHSQNFDGNANVFIKGHFTSGRICSINGTRLPFQFIGTQNTITPNTFGQNTPVTSPPATADLEGRNENAVMVVDQIISTSPYMENSFSFYLENKTNEIQLVTIILVAKPSNQRYTDTIRMQPREESKIILPNSILRGQERGLLTIQPRTGKSTLKMVQVSNARDAPIVGGIASGITGFITGIGSIGLGLIILLLILVVFVFAQGNRASTINRGASPEKQPFLKTNNPNTESAEMVLPEEPWMNPSKYSS